MPFVHDNDEILSTLLRFGLGINSTTLEASFPLGCRFTIWVIILSALAFMTIPLVTHWSLLPAWLTICLPFESGFCSFLRFGLDVFNTSEAAIVVMVVAMERPMISTEAECESQRVLLEFFWAQLTIFGIQCTIVRQLPR